MKKKLAFVDLSNFANWPVGGMLQYELSILDTLETYYDVELWGVRVDGEASESVIINNRQFEVHIFADVKTHGRIIPNFWKGLELGKYKQDFMKYDVIYVHTGSCAVAAATKLKTKDSMVVYHQHGLQYLNDFSIKTLLQRPFMTLAQKKTDFSFVVTGEKELAAYVAKRKNLQNKLVAIGSPIDLNLQKPKEDLVKRKGNTFIYVGRLAPIKRVRMLVKAYDRFCQRNGNDYKLFIVGDGEQRNKVERAVIATGLDSITLTGSVSEERVKEYLAQADYYITASAGEGASVAVLEAFAAGLPVVCFSVRGLREQVIAQKTGAVAKEETIEGLVNAMECVMKDRAELSKNCRLACMPYTKDLIGKRIVTEIDERYGKRT